MKLSQSFEMESVSFKIKYRAFKFNLIFTCLNFVPLHSRLKSPKLFPEVNAAGMFWCVFLLKVALRGRGVWLFPLTRSRYVTQASHFQQQHEPRPHTLSPTEPSQETHRSLSATHRPHTNIFSFMSVQSVDRREHRAPCC